MIQQEKNIASAQVIGKTTTNLDLIELPILSTSKPSVVSFRSTNELNTFCAIDKWCHDATDSVDSIKVKGRLPVLAMNLDALNSK